MSKTRRISSDDVRVMVAHDIRDFYDRLSARKVTICGFDLDDGCTGYANIWNAESTDHEYIGLVDLSCLESFV